MSRKQTQACTEKFRRKAFSRADQPDITAASVARELGIHSGQIYNWRQQFRRLSDKQFNAVGGVDYYEPESEAIGKLKREIDTLKKENEFLKRCLRTSRNPRSEVRTDGPVSSVVYRAAYVQGDGGMGQWLLSLEATARQPEGSTTGGYRVCHYEDLCQLQSPLRGPRIARELTETSVPCSVNYVVGIMRKLAVRARNGKAFEYNRTSEAMNNVAENLLWRQFSAERPKQKWTTDITYIWVNDRWLYLATIMDLFSRHIVGWSLDASMTAQLINDAQSMAYGSREVPLGLIVHSDRSVHYRSTGYQDYLRSRHCVLSMSRKGNFWDNAPMELFFSRLEVKLIYAEYFDSIRAAKSAIFGYIEVFYSRKRRHSALGYISSMEYERRCA